MSAFLHPIEFRRRPVALLALAALAMVLHLLAGSGLLRPPAAVGSGEHFVAELCTAHGLVAPGTPPLPAGRFQPASGVHDCCKLCAAGGSLLAANLAVTVAPAPTLAAPAGARLLLRAPAAPWSAHAPRGPPVPA